jgi:hypothetical protein
MLVPGFGPPNLKPDEPLPEAPAGLRLRLRDFRTGQILDDQPIAPAIAEVSELLAVTRAQFIPPRSGEANRLEVALRALPQMIPPACHVRLNRPDDGEIFHALRVPLRGQFEGDVEPGGRELTLFAEGIKVSPTEIEDGMFQVSVDGFQRALWYRCRFVSQGEPQVATLEQSPRIRFHPELVVKSGGSPKLRVQFFVDNAPRDSKLAFRLGRYQSQHIVDDITPWLASPKRRHIGFYPNGEGGALLFEASLEDWSKEFDLAGIRGVRRLQAWLLDASGGKELGNWGMDIVSDDLPPQDAAIKLPAEIEEGTTRLDVKATVIPPPSGIREAVFIVGSKTDFARIEAAGKSVRGKASGDDHRVWEATLPLPKDVGGDVVVTARFTSGVGLTAFVSAEAAVRGPAPPPSVAAAKPAPERPGAIIGNVTENDVAQPGLIVYLVDPSANETQNPVKATSKTARDGTFSFTDLKPGLYRVHCLKEVNNRRDSKDVTVKSGRSVRQNLNLLLP